MAMAGTEAPADEIALAEEAQRLLENPVLLLAFQRIEDGLLRSIKNSAPADLSVREEAYRLHWATEQLKAELRALVGAGRIKAKLRS